jgi:spermidine/putrescine transport system permease protein
LPRRLDPALEAALDLGATPRQAFWHVIGPIHDGGDRLRGLMAFTLSMDEFVVTYFTSGPDSVTLPVRIFGGVKKGLDLSLNAISALFILAVILMVLFSERLRRRQRS